MIAFIKLILQHTYNCLGRKIWKCRSDEINEVNTEYYQELCSSHKFKDINRFSTVSITLPATPIHLLYLQMKVGSTLVLNSSHYHRDLFSDEISQKVFNEELLNLFYIFLSMYNRYVHSL